MKRLVALMLVGSAASAGAIGFGAPAEAACQASQAVSTRANWSGNCTVSTRSNKYSDLTTAVQWVLNDLGYNVGTIDGIFGSKTKAAVIAFQKSQWPNDPSQWDGIVGRLTWGRLDNYLELHFSTSGHYYFAVSGVGYTPDRVRLDRSGAGAGSWDVWERTACSSVSGDGYVPIDSTRNCG